MESGGIGPQVNFEKLHKEQKKIIKEYSMIGEVITENGKIFIICKSYHKMNFFVSSYCIIILIIVVLTQLSLLCFILLLLNIPITTFINKHTKLFENYRVDVTLWTLISNMEV